MRFPILDSICAAFACAALVACGGGGGGGFALLPGALAFTVKVSVNGAAVSADAAGQYPVKAGDTIEIIPSRDASWSSSSATPGAVSPHNQTITAAKWSAQLANTTAAEAIYTVTATDTANPLMTQSATFRVAAADARNGSYKVFASNGRQLTLALDMDFRSYAMTDEQGLVASGSFSADQAEPGTYVFATDRIKPTIHVYNTARFRLAADGVVGAFPVSRDSIPPFFHGLTGDPTERFTIRPFVAARSFVTAQAQLDGTYNQLMVTRGFNSRDSLVTTARIQNGGTTMLVCNDTTGVHSIDQCPAAMLSTYSIAQGATPDRWEGTDLANPDPARKDIFYMARIDGQNVQLRSVFDIADSFNPKQLFRIGLAEAAAWPSITARGGSTQLDWGVVALDSTTYTRSSVSFTGAPATVSYPVSGIPGLLGLRAVNAAVADSYFAMQGARLNIVLGASSGLSTKGFMQIGLID